MTALLSAPEWAGLYADPLRDKRYQLTGLGTAVADHLAREHVRGLADRTLDQKERDLARMCVVLPHLDAGDVTTRHLEDVLATFPAGSRNRVRAHLRKFFDDLNGAGLIALDPARRLHTTRVQKQHVIDVFDRREQDALKHGPLEPRDRALARLLLETGLRLDEATALQMRDVDLDGHKFSVRRGKGRKARVVPATPATVQGIADMAILDGLDRDHHLFYRRYTNHAGSYIQHRHIAPGTFRAWWARVCDEANVRYRPPHHARHTYATELLLRGVSIAKVSRLLGHASIRTTVDEYAHLSVADLAEDVERAFAEQED